MNDNIGQYVRFLVHNFSTVLPNNVKELLALIPYDGMDFLRAVKEFGKTGFNFLASLVIPVLLVLSIPFLVIWSLCRFSVDAEWRAKIVKDNEDRAAAKMAARKKAIADKLMEQTQVRSKSELDFS